MVLLLLFAASFSMPDTSIAACRAVPTVTTLVYITCKQLHGPAALVEQVICDIRLDRNEG